VLKNLIYSRIFEINVEEDVANYKFGFHLTRYRIGLVVKMSKTKRFADFFIFNLKKPANRNIVFRL